MNTAKIKKKSKGSLWNYYIDEPSNPLSSNSEYLKYKTNITGCYSAKTLKQILENFKYTTS